MISETLKTAIDSSLSNIEDTISGHLEILVHEHLQRQLFHQREAVNQQRQELQQKRDLFENQKVEQLLSEKLSDLALFSSIIRLNVGGVHYSTSLDTLRGAPNHSLLYMMFSGAFFVRPDEEGRYFIDRNGKAFASILDQLRNGFTVLPLDAQKRKLVLDEARYYGIALLDQNGSPLAKDGYLDEQQDMGLNILNEVQTGGTAKVIYIDGLNGATVYNAGTMNGTMESSWSNNGCLISQTPPSTNTGGSGDSIDNPFESYRSNTATGSVWVNNNPGISIGRLVIDMGKSYQFSTVHVFPMRSDGQVTHIAVSYYDQTTNMDILQNNINASIDSTNWTRIVPMSNVSIGTSQSDTTVVNPTVFTFPPVRSRYMRIEAANDGSNGDPAFIEIRQLKAYY